MIWLLPPLSLAALAFAAISFGFVPLPHASTLIHFRSGTIRVARGRLKPHAKEHVTAILSEAGVSKAFITITSNNRVTFSRQIPSSIHQRLRNVLLNQWA